MTYKGTCLCGLDDAITQRPDSHLYTAYKANWHDITDTLPQHAEGRHERE